MTWLQKTLHPLILLLLLLQTPSLHAQQLETLPLLPPEAKEHHDLDFLKAELEGKRLVTLGELTHMYGNIFEMKARLVEYLHQELGYSTIAMESSMYDLWLMNAKHPSFEPAEFNRAVFGVWAQTAEFQRLVRYIDKHQLKVIGFDSQVVQQVPKFVDGFLEFCREKGLKIRLDEDDLGIAIEEVLDENLYAEDDIRFQKFERELQRLIGRIERLPATEENFHWLQFSKSLLATARDAYYEEEIAYKSDRADKNHNFRDAQMADNLLAYMERHPEEKILAWADNIHLINDLSSTTDPVLKEFVPMGSHLKKALGEEVYSLATVHANDSLLERTTWHQTPVLADSFEGRLAALEQPYLFVSSDQEAMRSPQQQRLLNFVDFSEVRLDQLHDGYIFLMEASLPQHQQEKSLAKGEGQEATSAASLTPAETSEAKTGQQPRTRLLDAETKLPVPYATVILLEGDLYRISNSEGYFELQQGDAIPSTGVLQISSMGYEPKELRLEELPGTIYLQPSFEQLEAVVLESYSSTPKQILKKAIKKIMAQYPMEALNFRRHGRFVLNRNDEKIQDLETITTDYLEGLREKDPTNWRVEQVKWHTRQETENYEYFASLPAFREDAVQFASILHKRRYKKFDLEFVASNKPEEQGLYIIRFRTDKTRFGYTNRWFPTAYSGLVYINKSDLAVVKLVQRWEMEFEEKDVEEVKYWLGEFKEEFRGKTEATSVYSLQQDGLYYPTEYFRREYTEKTNLKGEYVNHTLEGHSRLWGYTTESLEEFIWEDRKKDSRLELGEYDAALWEALLESSSM